MNREVREGWYEIRNLPRGEFIKRSQHAVKVYVKGDYDRATRAFSVYDYDDINSEMFVKRKTKVWAGFTY
jgi:hypothetical protein